MLITIYWVRAQYKVWFIHQLKTAWTKRLAIWDLKICILIHQNDNRLKLRNLHF